MFYDLFERVRKRMIWDDSFELTILIAIKYSLWFVLLQKSFHAQIVSIN